MYSFDTNIKSIKPPNTFGQVLSKTISTKSFMVLKDYKSEKKKYRWFKRPLKVQRYEFRINLSILRPSITFWSKLVDEFKK